MTTYVQSGIVVGGVNNDTLTAIETRVQSGLLQQIVALLAVPGQPQQDELRILRNDQAFELGIVPAVIPGN